MQPDKLRERRKTPRTTGQRIKFWGRRVLRLTSISFICGLLAMSALTAHRAPERPQIGVSVPSPGLYTPAGAATTAHKPR